MANGHANHEALEEQADQGEDQQCGVKPEQPAVGEERAVHRRFRLGRHFFLLLNKYNKIRALS